MTKGIGGFSILAITAVGLSITSPARAQDLGKLLGDAVRQELRQTVSPAGPGRSAPLNGPAERSSAAAEPHVVKTRDGWTLVALRYRPIAAAPQGAMPVILCHGLTYNAQFWDLDPSCSLARYLSAQGFDVWVVNLRGCGASQKWVWSLDQAPDAVFDSTLRRLTKGKLGSQTYTTIDPRFANWTMDDHINHDVPALVQLVRRTTRSPEVAWVGHSMGGIVALGHLSRYKNPGIGRLVTIGSQVTMPKGQVFKEYLREMFELRQKQLAGQPTVDDLVAMSQSGVHNLFFNTQNVLPKVYQTLSGPATDIPSMGLMLQYKALSEKGVLLDVKGQFNYAKALGNITVPIFISCGALDQFAPPQVQEFIYRNVGSTDKTLMVFGRRQGMSADAGHNDSLVGLNSFREVYPVIARWLIPAPQTATTPPPLGVTQ